MKITLLDIEVLSYLYESPRKKERSIVEDYLVTARFEWTTGFWIWKKEHVATRQFVGKYTWHSYPQGDRIPTTAGLTLNPIVVACDRS
jgi:hypothetical protein